MKEKEAQCRGDIFTTNLKYIKKKYGQDGIGKLQKELKKRGSKLVLKDLKDLDWYPMEERIIFLESVYDSLLKPQGRKLYDFAYDAPRNRGMLKLFVRVRYSPHELADKASSIWSDYYTVGKISMVEKREYGATLHLKEFYFEPYELMIEYMTGYFQSFFELTGAKEPKLEILRMEDEEKPYFKIEANWKYY